MPARHGPAQGTPSMLICKICGRKINAAEVKYRIAEKGESWTICADCAKGKGLV